MPRSRAAVPTAAASKYLQQLCKHFAHKVTVDYDATRGRVDFPFGLCLLAAEGDVLRIDCSAGDDAALARMHDVVGQHLERFAWREKPEIVWLPEG